MGPRLRALRPALLTRVWFDPANCRAISIHPMLAIDRRGLGPISAQSEFANLFPVRLELIRTDLVKLIEAQVPGIAC